MLSKDKRKLSCMWMKMGSQPMRPANFLTAAGQASLAKSKISSMSLMA